MIWFWIILGIAFLIFLIGVRIIRPTHRGVVETLGKYTGFREPGFNWVVPFFQQLRTVNITEQMQSIDSHEAITQDNLNVEVDLVVYYKVKPDEKSVKSSFYNVEDFESQIISLSQTTARNVIGNMLFKDVNSKRNALNVQLAKILETQVDAWGMEIVRVEMKEIRPPKDVQETMNKIIKAENEKDAAKDFATARETEADGIKRAAIKEAEGKKTAAILEAEGIKQGRILVAEGEAQKIKLVNEAAEKYFKGNAQLLRKYDVTENSLRENAKIIVAKDGINPNLIIGELPLKK